MTDNRSVVRRVYSDIWSRGNVGALPELFATDLAFADRDDRSLQGFAGLQELVRRWHTGFPDMHEEVLDLVVEGNKAMCRFRLTGTHRSSFLGISATGCRIAIEGVDIYALRDGKIVSWEYVEDTLGLLRELGQLPP